MMDTQLPDPTLLSPRILCLHGGGTNAQIFRLQCRVLSQHLSPSFRLCYVQAPFPSPGHPDILAVYGNYGPFRSWFPGTLPDHMRQDDGAKRKGEWAREVDEDSDSDSVEEEDVYSDATVALRIQEALHGAMKEDDAKGATGEWVGLMGFSQGARVCASLLHLQQRKQQPHHYHAHDILERFWPVFRFGVLIAGRGPLVSLAPHQDIPRGLVGAAAAMTELGLQYSVAVGDRKLVQVPTIHLHGLLDPGLEHHRRFVVECFDARSVVVRDWKGGHRVPIRTEDVSMLVREITALN
ncbi:hypothetical protein OPT61_g9674 [Boeremia exigua]|uniref:Uncharacterized protein n=1 Tax=Boeremia exigua TaxID=749465 RepID=A0ACC2HUN1_9PLEO|nr:hypothetical protein OPT61_g9674 [Boeremia exigua]